MNLYAFDVDETLEISNGPVTLAMLEELRSLGHIVGICGNMFKFCTLPDWYLRVSFLGQGNQPKEYFLDGLRRCIRGVDEFIMVGNILGACNSLGFVCGSDDSGAAARVGWRFIKEDDFAKGVR